MTPRLQGEVVGFRTWHIDDELRLSPRSVGEPWTAGVNEAKCYRDLGHRAPSTKCECGLYAFHEPEARPTATIYAWGQTALSDVPGVVLAWGNLDVHHAGFRAEFAQPLLLGYEEAWSRLRRETVRTVAREYHMELAPVRELPRLALEHGSPVPSAMRPKYDEPALLGPSMSALQAVWRQQTAGTIYHQSTTVIPLHAKPSSKQQALDELRARYVGSHLEAEKARKRQQKRNR